MTAWPTRSRRVSIRWRMWIDGEPYALAAHPRRTLEPTRDGRGMLQVETIAIVPAAARGTNAIIEICGIGTSGTPVWRPFFRGVYWGQMGSAGPYVRRGAIFDALHQLDTTPASEITWDNRAFVDAVGDILLAAGIASSQIGTIFNPGQVYAVGNVQPITIETSQNLADVWRDLMDFGGTRAYCSPSGKIHVIAAVATPSSATTTLYEEGLYTSGARGLEHPELRYGGLTRLISRVEVQGAQLEGEDPPNATYTSTTVTGGQRITLRFNLAQTGGTGSESVCLAIAKREMRRQCRSARAPSWRALFHPNATPGQSVRLKVPSLEGSSLSLPAILTCITNDGGVGDYEASLGPSLVAGEAGVLPSDGDDGEGEGVLYDEDGYLDCSLPLADFVLFLDQELDSNGDPLYIAMGDGTVSTSPTGAPLTYAWDPGTIGNPTPPSSTAPMTAFAYSTLEGATLGLEVSDGTNTAAISIALDDERVEVWTRIIVLAGNGPLYVLANPSRGWLHYGTDVEAVARYYDGGLIWFGQNDGGIYTVDINALGDDPVLRHTVSSPVSSIFVGETWYDETIGDTIIVGYGHWVDWTHDGGTTWDTWDFESGAVLEVAVSPFAAHHMRVASSPNLYQTVDDGQSWAVEIEPNTGSIVTDIGVAGWGTAAACLGPDRVLFADDATVDWGDVSFEADEEVTTITPGLLEEAWRIGTSAGQIILLTRDSDTGDYAATLASSSTTTNLGRLTCDGKLPFTLVADTSGAYKLLHDGHELIKIHDDPASRCGYGFFGKKRVIVSAYLYMIPFNTSAPYDYLWRYDFQIGVWSTQPMPSPALRGTYLAVNPTDSNQLLLVAGGSAARVFWGDARGARITRSAGNAIVSYNDEGPLLYYSGDAGASWSSVTLPGNAETTNVNDGAITWCGFLSDGTLAVQSRLEDTSSGGKAIYYWLGTADAMTGYMCNLSFDWTREVGGCWSGTNGDAYMMYNISGKSRLIAEPAGTETVFFPSQVGPNYPVAHVLSDGVGVVCGSRDERLGHMPDYTASTPTYDTLTANNTCIVPAIGAEDTVFCGGGLRASVEGLRRVNDITSPTATIVDDTHDVIVGYVATDSLRSGLVAYLDKTNHRVRWSSDNGSTWETIALPGGGTSWGDFGDVLAFGSIRY